MTDMLSYETYAQSALPEEGKVRRVAAYCRVSTLQEEQELSYETQRAYYTKRINDDPTMTLVGVYGDYGESGLMMKRRPDFQRMINDCLDGRIDLILTKSVSRFARNLSDCVNCVRILRERGITVIFEKDGIDSADSKSEMLLSLIASLAQEEVRNLSENIRWSFDHRNANGNPARPARYGYRKITDGNGKSKWLVCETEANRVRAAFQMAERGKNCRDILDKLNDMELKDGTGAVWSRARLYSLLKSEVYIGDILTNKTYTEDYLTKKVSVNSGQKPQYYIEGHHEAIINKATFERVGKLIRDGKLKVERGKRR